MPRAKKEVRTNKAIVRRNYNNLVFYNNSIGTTIMNYLCEIKGLKDDLPALRFITGLKKTNFRDKIEVEGTKKKVETGHLVANCEFLAACMEIPQKHAKTIELLKGVTKYDPDLGFLNHSVDDKRARVITSLKKGDMYDRCLNPEQEMRYVDTKKQVTRKDKLAQEKQIKELILQLDPVTEDQKLQINYLLDRKLAVYDEAAMKNAVTIQKAIEATPDPEKQKMYWDKIRMLGRPFPWPSLKEGSLGSRVYHKWLSSLSGTVRHAWLPFTLSLDIANCQLSILGGMLGINSINDFLGNGGDFWEEIIINHMGVPLLYKPIVKQSTYSLCYGMGWDRLHNELKTGLNGIAPRRSFFTHPIVKDLYKAVRKAQADIEEKGGMASSTRWIPLEGRQPNTVLSYAAQDEETAITSAIYRKAISDEKNNHETFQILGHVHDEVMIDVYTPENRKKVIETCNKLVRKEGLDRGMIIRLHEESFKTPEEVLDLETSDFSDLWF